jgi:hypothetical protein
VKDTEIFRNVVFLGQVNVNNAYDFPTTAGTAGQVLSYDGSGNLAWSSLGTLSLTTSDIAEGVNLYFTQERAEDATAGLIQNGTGLTWTYDDTANTLVGNVSLSGFDTDALSEGTTNLYFTDERVDDRVSNLMTEGTGINLVYNDTANTLTASIDFTEFTTDDVIEGTTNLYLTNERVDDRVSDLIKNGTGISWNYNDGAGHLTPTVSLSPFDTDALSEGTTNLYFTDERVDDRVSNLMTNTSSVTFVYDDVANTISAIASAVMDIQKGGTTVSNRSKINFIEGTGVTINVADDGINSRSNVTISTSLSQNLASDNLTQDPENRTYNMSGQDLTFNNGYFKVTDSSFNDMLFFEHNGGDITFGGANGIGTGGSNWIHQNNQQTGVGVGTSTVWEHRDYAGNAGLKLTNWYTTGGLNQYCTINYDGGLGSMYILNNGGGPIQLGTSSTINIGYGTGSSSPETLKLCAKAGEFIITGAAAGVGSTTFKDLSATKAGIEYDADYSLTFSGLSLINRDFADARYAPLSTSTSAGSGLTLTSGVIDLGGAITADTVIEGTGSSGFDLSLGVNLLNKNLDTFNINAREKFEKYSSGSFPYSSGGSSLFHDEQGVITDVNYETGINVRKEILSSSIQEYVINTDVASRISSKIFLSSNGCSVTSMDIDNNTGTFLNIKKSLIGMASVTSGSYGSPVMKFEIDADNSTTKFTDFRTTTKGIEYAANYHSGYTDRTLIDRGYADVTYALAASGITDGDKGDITVSGGGANWTIDSGAVSLNKIQTIASQRILGRYSTGTGVVQQLTIGTGLSLSGSGELTAASSSSSSGQIRVIRDSDNGVPTYFSDLQTALETCKAANTTAVITLYDNITLTSQIQMVSAGSAANSGEGYVYSNMLIDFNGFTVTLATSGSDPAFLVILSTGRTLNLINGSLTRTVGTAPALSIPSGQGDFIINNMYIYSNDGNAAQLNFLNDTEGFANFGDSVFESNYVSGLYIEKYNAKSFTAISNSSAGLSCQYGSAYSAKLTDFTAINTGANSGNYAITLNGNWDLSNFYAKSNAGDVLNVDVQFQGLCSRFDLESTSGKGIDFGGISTSSYIPRFSNFTIVCSDNYCIDSNSAGCSFSNFFITNDSSSATTISEVNTGSTSSNDNKYYNGTVINKNGPALEVTNSTRVCFKDVSFTSVQDIPVVISLGSVTTYSVDFVKCNIKSELASASGSGVQMTNSVGSVDIRNCDIEVSHASARCIKGSSTGQKLTLRNTDLKGSSTYLENVTLNTVYVDIYGNTTT